jgi:hypothetical protein
MFSSAKKQRALVNARSVVELHFSNHEVNAPLSVPLVALAGKGPQHFLDQLCNKAMKHIRFSEDQLELLSLHFVFRGRRLNYNGIKFIEENAGKIPVTVVHVQLDYNYERVGILVCTSVVLSA